MTDNAIIDTIKTLLSEEDRTYTPVINLEELQRLGGLWTLGTSKATKISKRKISFVMDEAVETEINFIYGIKCSYSDVAKAILQNLLAETQRKKARFSKETEEFFKGNITAHHPLYAIPTTINGVYIDLKSTYYTIVKTYYPMAYSRMQYISLPYNRQSIEIEEYITKSAKVSTFSLARSPRMTIFNTKTGNIEIKTSLNNYLNDIAVFTYDYLQALALKMIKLFNAVYVHTDGYIVPEEKTEEALEFLSEYWIGQARVKYEGLAIVKTAGVYAIGRHITHNYDKINPKHYTNIYIDEELADWLLKNVRTHIREYINPSL